MPYTIAELNNKQRINYALTRNKKVCYNLLCKIKIGASRLYAQTSINNKTAEAIQTLKFSKRAFEDEEKGSSMISR